MAVDTGHNVRQNDGARESYRGANAGAATEASNAYSRGASGQLERYAQNTAKDHLTDFSIGGMTESDKSKSGKSGDRPPGVSGSNENNPTDAKKAGTTGGDHPQGAARGSNGHTPSDASRKSGDDRNSGQRDQVDLEGNRDSTPDGGHTMTRQSGQNVIRDKFDKDNRKTNSSTTYPDNSSDNTKYNADGSRTTNHFDSQGIGTKSETVNSDGSYSQSDYAKNGGVTTRSFDKDRNYTGATKTLQNPDGSTQTDKIETDGRVSSSNTEFNDNSSIQTTYKPNGGSTTERYGSNGVMQKSETFNANNQRTGNSETLGDPDHSQAARYQGTPQKLSF